MDCKEEPFPIQDLPSAVICEVLSYLTYDQVAKMRIVSKFFDSVCRQHLNRGFQIIEHVQSRYLKKLKAQLPRRESARRSHPFARHCDILTAIDTRLNLLSMTFSKYIDAKLCCFIPGKIIDEIYNVINVLKNSLNEPPKYSSEVLQELRDISSMAMEHFDDKIVPGLLQAHQAKAITSSPLMAVSPNHLTPSRLLSNPAFYNMASASSPSVSSSSPRAFSLGRVSHVRDEFLAHKKKMSEALTSQKIFFKKVLKKHRDHIEALEKELSSQANLISAQSEMLKEMNKKMLENEQKLADFLQAKDVVCSSLKRQIDEEDGDSKDECSQKKKLKAT